MKKALAAIFLTLLLTGCAQTVDNTESPDVPDPIEATGYPTPAIADNSIPKSCVLPEIIDLTSEMSGEAVQVDPNPVNTQNSNEENLQEYLAGRYLVCVFKAESSGKATFLIWDEGNADDWSAAMQEINLNLEAGEGLFEEVSLGLGELAAFALLEEDADLKIYTGHAFIKDISVFVYTDALSNKTEGEEILKAAIRAMP